MTQGTAHFRAGSRWAGWVLFLLAACGLGVAHAAQPPATPLSTDGMIAWWPGDGHPNDVFGTNHGRLAAGTQYAPAVFGSGFSFDGVDDRVEIPDADALKLTQSLSISVWIYPRIVPGPTRAAQIFFRGDNRNGFDPYSISLTNNHLIFHLESLTSGTYLQHPITAGRFYHVVATLDDATGWMRLYVDGALVAEQITQVRPFRDLLPQWDPGISIGDVQNYPNPLHFQPFAGTIDELKVYNRARTAFEIADDYALGLSESLLVTSFEADRVARFDAGNGTFIDTVAGGGLTDPSGLTFGPDGNLYVGSQGNDRVLKYSATTGQYLTTFVSTGSGGLDGPEGLAFGPDGHLYVASRFTNQVLRYHGQTGAFLGVFASGGGLDTPFDLAFGPDCHLYVSSRGNASVLRYDGHTGALHGEFVPSGAAGLEVDEPRGITFGPDGHLYVASPRSDRVLRFHGSTGALLGAFVAAGAGGLDEPAGIRFGPDGALYVTSTTTNDVKRFDGASGQFRDVFAVGGGLSQATFLTFSPAAVANRAPIAKAGADVEVQSTGEAVQVQLDGSRSCDLDADPLTYEWREGSVLLGSTPTIAPLLGPGIHTVTLTVRDPFLTTGQDQVTVSVLETVVPPSNLTATAISSSAIHLSWQDNSGDEDGFEIERRTEGAFAPVAISGPDSTAFDDVGLLPLTAYTYRIRGVKAGGISAYTPEASATTLIAPTAAPSDLSAGAVSDTEVRLHWIDNSDTETGFEIERRLANGGFAQVGVAAASPSSGRAVNFLDALALVPNTTYGYRVRATGPGGSSPYSNEAPVTTSPIPPTAPTALTLTGSGATTILLSWTDTSVNETGFRVERKIGGGAFTFVGETAADQPSFPDLGLTVDTIYTYRVRALGTAGDSAFSTEATLPTPPSAPSGLMIAIPGAGQLALTWTDNSRTESEFKILRRTSSGVFATAGTVAAGVTAFLDSGVAAGVTYTYQIRAVNAGGDSAPSSSVTRLTLPATPSDFSVTPFSSTQLDLSWTDGNPSPPPIKVERSTDGGMSFTQVAVSPGAATVYRDNGLTPETTYHYRIRTTNASGDSAVSAIASGRTFPPPPASPAVLTAVAVSGRSVQLTWQDRSQNEAGFEVWRLGPADSAFRRLAFAPANSTAYLDRLELSGLTTYQYRVRAINDGGASAFALSNSVNTPADVPAAPTSPAAASFSSSQIRVTWADASDNESGFQVERKPAGGGFTLATTTAAGVTEFVDGSRAESAAYTYRVIAVNAQGSSPPSGEVTATTRPAAPGSLVAAAGNRKVDLSWTDNSALETGFRIERKTGGDGFATLLTVAAGTQGFADTAVIAGVSYTYRVLAVGASGDSTPSNESSAIPRNETPLAKLTVAPKAVNFKTVRLGKTARKTFKLTNKGKEALSGVVGPVSAPFVLSSGGGAFTLAPRKSRVVTLTWTPSATGPIAGSVEVNSTDPRQLRVEVRLSGKAR